MEEHRVIERVLNVLVEAAKRLAAGDLVEPDLVEKSLDFIRNFADRCHHGKEESNLFPFLERRGISKESGPIGVMLSEHDIGRSFVKSMAESLNGYRKGDRDAGRSLARAMNGYVELLREHIFKEDNILFKMADSVLTGRDQEYLHEKFEEVEEELGSEFHHKYVALVEELEASIGRNKAAH